MFAEEECFALQSLNAPHCICCYEDINEQPRLLVVNETGLLALRAGLGPACNRYGLEPLPAESIPDGAKLVACNVVRTSRGGGESLGMVCMAMLTPQVTVPMVEVEEEYPRTDGGTKQGDSAGGPSVRSAAATSQTSAGATTAAAATAAAAAAATSVTAAAVGGGMLNVYALGGERGFEVERALKRQPQQQILLPFAPEGMAHTTVWRRVTAVPNFVGGAGGEGAGAGTSATASPSNSHQRRYRVERGDAVLVWDQDGVVHGYTRWEGGGGRLAADSSTSRGGGGVGSGSGGRGAAGYAAKLRAEPRESLEKLIPELRGMDGRVSCLSFGAAEGGESPSSRRPRRLLAGCKNSVRCSLLEDVATGRGETVVASVAGPVCDVAFNSCPRFMPHDRRVDDAWGGDVAGFACTELDTLAWLVNGGGGGGGGGGGRRMGGGLRWCTGTLPLPGAGGDQVTCMGCANFCRDGSTCVAVGTSLGKVVVYGADAHPDDDGTTEVGIADNDENDDGLAFRLGDADYEDKIGNVVESDSCDASSSRRGEGSTSPRPPGAAAAAAAGVGRQQQHHHNRHVAERLSEGGGGGGAYRADDFSVSTTTHNNPRPPLLSVRWQRHVPHGVLRIACGDFNHDGVSELVVVTHYGVHVFHPDYREEANRFAKTMWTLKMLQQKEENEEYGHGSSVSTASAGDDEETSSRGVNSLGMEIRNNVASAD